MANWLVMSIVIGLVIALLPFLVQAIAARRPRPTPQERLPPRRGGPFDDEWEKVAAETELKAPANIRAAAEKWGATLTALTGVFGLVALVRTPADISGLAEQTRAAIGICILIAVVFAALAIWTAAIAAQGIPHALYIDADQVRRDSHAQANSAARWLRASRYLVWPALGFVAIAMSIAWTGPKASKIWLYSQPAATPTPGFVVCGKLEDATAGHVMLAPLTPTSAQPTVPVADAKQLTEIAVCP